MPTETLSTESRLTTEVRGMGSSPGSSSTSLGIPRMVVVQGPISVGEARNFRRETEPRPGGVHSPSLHHRPPRAEAVTTRRRPCGTRRGFHCRPRRAVHGRRLRRRRRSHPAMAGEESTERLIDECRIRVRRVRRAAASNSSTVADLTCAMPRLYYIRGEHDVLRRGSRRGLRNAERRPANFSPGSSLLLWVRG